MNFNTLVPNDVNGGTDAFVHDRQTQQTQRVSVDSAGQASTHQSFETLIKAASPDGRYVLFDSFEPYVPEDTNGLSDVYLHDRQTGKTERISVNDNGQQTIEGQARGSSLSADGRFVGLTSTASLVPADTNNDIFDAYIWDRQTRHMQLLNDLRKPPPPILTR